MTSEPVAIAAIETPAPPRPARRAVRPRAAVPGEALLHPSVLLAVAVLVLNDHWLKHRLGADARLGVVTGKLSDVAGLAFFPLLLVSLLELARWAAGSRDRGTWAFTRRELAGAVVVTGVGFAAVQVLPVVAGAYAQALAGLRWLPTGLVAVVTGASSPPLPRVDHVMDATDNLCLPALWWGYVVGVRTRDGRSGRPTRPADQRRGRTDEAGPMRRGTDEAGEAARDAGP